MDSLYIKKVLVFSLIFTVGISVSDAQDSGSGGGRHSGKGLFGIFPGKKRGSKVKAPKSVNQVKKEQEKKDKKLKEDYVKSIRESQKRTVKIQSPEVRDRMKQNQKDIKAREKTKKAKTSASTKKAAKKYKK